MGLDMFAFRTSAWIPATDFKGPDDSRELACWRKHPDLHGWMEALYRRKGGNSEAFNCDTLRLDLDDLDALEQAVLADALPHTEGFFFGESRPEEKALDLAFIARARQAIEEGDSVFYDSWW